MHAAHNDSVSMCYHEDVMKANDKELFGMLRG